MADFCNVVAVRIHKNFEVSKWAPLVKVPGSIQQLGLTFASQKVRVKSLSTFSLLSLSCKVIIEENFVAVR